MVASRTKDGKTTYSLSCNPDTALDIAPKLLELRAKGKKVAIVAEVNNELPFMINHAEVEPEEFDIILDNRKYDCKLFGAPNMAITPSDHFIGFNASTLVKDGGTLQVGIGSLGSALVNGAIMRHKNNQDYTELVSELGLEKKFPVINEIGGHGTF